MNNLKTFLPYLFGNKKGKSYVLPQGLDWTRLSFEESLMFHSLAHTLPLFLDTLDIKTLTPADVYHLYSFHELLPAEFFVELKSIHSHEWTFFIESLDPNPIDAQSLQELIDFPVDQLSVFAFLHTDRTRPGKLMIRKKDGRFMTDQEGHLWSIPVLGLSGRGLPFNHSNGCTPKGIFTIDSVMPDADKNYDFGQFRRLIVNFIPKSLNENSLKQLMPALHKDLNWWKQSLVGRELGRSLLRIHGTGRKNLNPLVPFFPMVPTSGCLATAEVDFYGLYQTSHQRTLLDTLMQALGLDVSSMNESKIHGLLYVIEFDGRFQTLEFRH